MKYLLMIAVLGMSSSFAFADNSIDRERKLKGEHDVEFSCQFRSADKKGDRCWVEGEVCVNFGHKDVTGTGEDGHKCDRNRDDNRIRIRCTDGYVDNDRARARIERERGEGEDLIIRSTERGDRREDRVEIEEFERFDGDNDADDNLRAKFTRDNNSGGRFFGRCRLRLERRGEGMTNDSLDLGMND